MQQGIIFEFNRCIESDKFSIKKMPFLELQFKLNGCEIHVQPLNFHVVTVGMSVISCDKGLRLIGLRFNTGIKNIIDQQSKNGQMLRDRNSEFDKMNEAHIFRTILSPSNSKFLDIIPCELSPGDEVVFRIAKNLVDVNLVSTD